MPSEYDSWSIRLTRFSLDKPVSVLVLLLSVLVVGGVAGWKIPRELMPKGYVAQSLEISVPWQDAPAQEVLDKITLPLEEEVSTVKNLDGLFSRTATGRSYISLHFKQGTDMAVARKSGTGGSSS